MNKAFADTAFFIALLSPHDELHASARAEQRRLQGLRTILFTTDMVLTEWLDGAAERGPQIRKAVCDFIAKLNINANVKLVPTADLFKRAFKLYRDRRDKGWSLTDCASFCVMNDFHIKDALTSDEHFVEAGFNILLR